MGSLFLSLLTVALVLLCGFIILIVLMQRTSNTGGMGAALGGSATEQVFGAETTNVLTKATIYGTIGFFCIALLLYLMYQSGASTSASDESARELAGAAPAEAVPAEGLDFSEFAASSLTPGTATVSASEVDIDAMVEQVVQDALGEAAASLAETGVQESVAEGSPESPALEEPIAVEESPAPATKE